MNDAVSDDVDWAEDSASTAAQSNDFPSNAILLVGKFEGGECGPMEHGVCTVHVI